MKKFILALLVLSMISAPCMVYSQDIQETKQEQKEREKREKEEKKQKEKAEKEEKKRLEKEEKERKKKENEGKPKWAGLPEKMSGIADVDAYILTVDSIYTNLNSYTDRINFYTQKTTPLLDANGEQVKSEDGQGYLKTEITDQDGNKVSITQLLIQLPEISVSLLGLTSEALKVTSGGLSAATAFISKPFAAFEYGKYLKDGPGVMAYIGKEGARLVSTTKKQYDVLTKLRKSEATNDFGLDINHDETIINTEKDYAEAIGVEDLLEALESVE